MPVRTKRIWKWFLVDQKRIEEFENDNLDRVFKSPMFAFLKNKLIRKKYFLQLKYNIVLQI